MDCPAIIGGMHSMYAHTQQDCELLYDSRPLRETSLGDFPLTAFPLQTIQLNFISMHADGQ